PRGLVQSRATITPQPTETATILPLIDTATPTGTPLPTEPPTATSDPPSPTATEVSPTEASPTGTPLPTAPPPPTDTPSPTDTPAPSYSFTVAERNRFPTGKPDFDMFIAVTNADNRPIGGYRVVGNHSAGAQFESAVSTGDWTENSGANHYKAGNIKVNVPNSPDGVWTLQLLDEAGQSVAAPLEIPFDTSDPAWHFVLFQRSN
ncbi:MAG: hypothetical protein R3264_03090, partial [Anaerolineae bacterium]|nr:hypothetical protein [Anaerolineae bacterium]